MIRHILLVKCKSAATSEQVDAVKSAFVAIPQQVSGIEDVEWGVNDSPEGKNQDYTLCIFMTFANEEARQTYLTHPAHNALKVVFRQIIEDIIVFDYSK